MALLTKDFLLNYKSYGMGANELAKAKLNRVRDIKDIIASVKNADFKLFANSKLEILANLLNDCDFLDYRSIIQQISASELILKGSMSVNNKDEVDLFVSKYIHLLFILKIVLKAWMSRDESDENNKLIYSQIKDLVISIENTISSIQQILLDRTIQAEIYEIGQMKNDLYRKAYNIDTAKVKIIYISPKDKYDVLLGCANASRHPIMESSDGTYIKSMANYSTTKYFPQLTTREFNAEAYANNIFNEKDIDYLVNKAYKLSEYLFNIIDLHDALFLFEKLTDYLFDSLIKNSTGLNIIRDQLVKCKEILNTAISTSYEHRETLDRLIKYCDSKILSIEYILEDKTIDIIESSTPLIEMGFGFIYDIIPSNIEDLPQNEVNKVAEALNECISSTDIYEVLTEGIISKLKRRKYDGEFEDKKRNDEYDFEAKKRDDKYEFEQKKKQDKYEEKKRREQEDYEEKKKKKEEAAKRTKTLGVAWKTMELSSPAVHSAVRGLKRLIAAAGIGGVAAAAGFNPVFLPIVYLLGKYFQDKRFPDLEKRKVMMELRSNIQQIDAKIEQAERQDDMKQKYQLMKMKEKMESIYNRYNYGLNRGAVL